MELQYYAVLDENGMCNEIIAQDFENTESNYVPISEYDAKYLGASYENEAWTFPVQPEAAPTILDRLEKLLPLVDAMSTTLEPSDKLGFNWRVTRLADMVILKEYVEVANTADGTADNPFEWVMGIELVPNAYYMYNGVRFVWMGANGISDTPPVDDGGDWVEF